MVYHTSIMISSPVSWFRRSINCFTHVSEYLVYIFHARPVDFWHIFPLYFRFCPVFREPPQWFHFIIAPLAPTAPLPRLEVGSDDCDWDRLLVKLHSTTTVVVVNKVRSPTFIVSQNNCREPKNKCKYWTYHRQRVPGGQMRRAL